MCGIVGWFTENNPVPLNKLKEATGQLHHRGPDHQEVWLSPNQQVGLGHARLSIIDLLTGDQPLSNEDGRIHAVVNGELYGYQEIRYDLEKKGHHFKTKSDSEILVHLYEELGAHCIHSLRGEFSFVLWDENSKTLIAGRDRFGIKPLFYSVLNGSLILASEMKALFATGVPAAWDRESVFQANQLWVSTQDKTLFQGVYQVPPGHYLLATRGRKQIIRYWDFDYPQELEQIKNPSDAIQGFRKVFEEAIDLRLQADVPVACYLSGGLDSCSVLGFAAQRSKDPVHAFTLGFEHADYDETAIAEEMARKAGAEFHSIPIRYDDLADHFSDAVWHAETPFINAHGIAKYLLSKAVRDAGFKVVLTGEGSDEILAGYPHFKNDFFTYSKALDPEKLALLLEELRNKNKVSAGSLLAHGESVSNDDIKRVLGFVPTFVSAFSSMGMKLQGFYSKEYKSWIQGVDAGRRLIDGLDFHGQLRGRDPVNQSLYLWSKSVLPNYILSVLGDRMEMAHSVEGRLPFLDHSVVEFAKKLPMNLKINGTIEKYILREAAKPVITQTIYERQKHPFLAPPASLNVRGKLYELLRDTVASRKFTDLPFFDASAVASCVERIPSLDTPSQTAFDSVFCQILSLSFLQERFKISY